MKTTKITIIGMVLTISAILSGCSNSVPMDDPGQACGAVSGIQQFESLNGSSEFYFKPVGDNRIWHVLNRYSSSGAEENPGYNTSEYTFTTDSVSVVNNIIGIPDLDKTGPDLAGFISVSTGKEN